MIVHRLLDAFFRTLDAVDAVRDRIDRVLGKEPRPDPFAVEWPAEETAPSPAPSTTNGNGAAHDPLTQRASHAAGDGAAVAQVAVAQVEVRPAKKAAREKPVTKSSAPAKAKTANEKPRSSRKGSVDRSGKDFDSPRAKAIHQHLSSGHAGVVTEAAELDGKKVLARVLWALKAAEDAGSELGLTTADASALLHLAGGMEVYATNIGRTCRDHDDLIEESEPDGRSKRYRLTEKGRARAGEIETRA